MNDDLQLPSSAMAFAVGFFFSFRAVIPLFSVRVLGTEPRTGAEVSLALTFFLLGLVCFHSLGPGQPFVALDAGTVEQSMGVGRFASFHAAL